MLYMNYIYYVEYNDIYFFKTLYTYILYNKSFSRAIANEKMSFLLGRSLAKSLNSAKSHEFRHQMIIIWGYTLVVICFCL